MPSRNTPKRPKLPRKRCAGCKKHFQPRRTNHTACKPGCRYLKYSRAVQRVRIKSTETPLQSWTYVQGSASATPLGLFAEREDALAFARYLRRRQRTAPPTERQRYSVGLCLPPPEAQNPMRKPVKISPLKTERPPKVPVNIGRTGKP